MTARVITLRILTTEGVAKTDDAVAVVAPGDDGYLGFLRNHAPLVSVVRSGTLRWRRPDGRTSAVRVGPGLLEIVHNRFTLLTSAITELPVTSGLI